MIDLFPNSLDAINNSHYLAKRCKDNWAFINTIFPGLSLKDTFQANKKLNKYTYEGAAIRYGEISSAISIRIEHELNLIMQKGFAPYFLIVKDIVSQTKSTIGEDLLPSVLVIVFLLLRLTQLNITYHLIVLFTLKECVCLILI